MKLGKILLVDFLKTIKLVYQTQHLKISINNKYNNLRIIFYKL